MPFTELFGLVFFSFTTVIQWDLYSLCRYYGQDSLGSRYGFASLLAAGLGGNGIDKRRGRRGGSSGWVGIKGLHSGKMVSASKN